MQCETIPAACSHFQIKSLSESCEQISLDSFALPLKLIQWCFVKNACHMVHGSRVDFAWVMDLRNYSKQWSGGTLAGGQAWMSGQMQPSHQPPVPTETKLSNWLKVFYLVFVKAHSIQPRNQTVISEYHITYFFKISYVISWYLVLISIPWPDVVRWKKKCSRLQTW